MSDTNHAATAKQLSNLDAMSAARLGTEQASVRLRAAQVHATLELAEQQSRAADAAEIANLIAWKQVHTARAVDERGLFNDLPVTRDDLSDRIEAEMGLGL